MSIRRMIVVLADEDTVEKCAGACHIKAHEIRDAGGDKELAAYLEGSAHTVQTIFKNEYIKDHNTFLSHVLAHYSLEVNENV